MGEEGKGRLVAIGRRSGMTVSRGRAETGEGGRGEEGRTKERGIGRRCDEREGDWATSERGKEKGPLWKQKAV